MPDDTLYQRLITVARQLNEPGEINFEYVRGQAELIADACGLSMDEDRARVLQDIAGPDAAAIADLTPTARRLLQWMYLYSPGGWMTVGTLQTALRDDTDTAFAIEVSVKAGLLLTAPGQPGYQLSRRGDAIAASLARFDTAGGTCDH